MRWFACCALPLPKRDATGLTIIVAGTGKVSINHETKAALEAAQA